MLLQDEHASKTAKKDYLSRFTMQAWWFNVRSTENPASTNLDEDLTCAFVHKFMYKINVPKSLQM